MLLLLQEAGQLAQPFALLGCYRFIEYASIYCFAICNEEIERYLCLMSSPNFTTAKSLETELAIFKLQELLAPIFGKYYSKYI